MSFKEKYKSVFSQVRSLKAIEMEDFIMKQSIRKSGRKIVALAAAVCLLAALSVSALAMNLFGLRDMILPSGGIIDNENTNSNTETPASPKIISLQGYSDSKEYQAVAEWMAFLDSYDKDGELLAKVGNGPTGLDEKYSLYLVYTQEMADKLEEIVEKYGLKLHRAIELDLSEEDLYKRAGTGKFLGENNSSFSAYIYEDGTFHIDGEVVLDENRTIAYQMMNCVKGSFTDVILNIGNPEDYNEWTYTTSSGVTVSLSISPSKSLIIADLNNSFVTINVLAGSDPMNGAITTLDLEAFADTFDFSALN